MSTKNMLRLAAIAVAGSLLATPVLAAEGHGPTPPRQKWSFDGLFGSYDRAALQRGYQVYQGVCAACHGLSLVAYRDLRDIGLSDNQIKDAIKDIQVTDGPNDAGEMFERPALLSDRFKKPYPNEQAAIAANGALPPDLSLLAKARIVEAGSIPVIRSFAAKIRYGGPDYIQGVLTGYKDFATLTPEERTALKLPEKLADGQYYNEYFKGHVIRMPPPLTDGAVTFLDEAPNTAVAMAHDVTTFLTWAAEPRMEQRKQTGLKVVLFLLVLAGLMYMVKRKVWANVPH
ncbi:MAG: cytochrome c1 [Alphaproteobacteria bacterium]|jgi:ubiquinol-cytochrome c reductase cytochrome b/c1 subunit|nr:cytochrome c1 [Alphaproteobacteria bacterium]